MLNQTVKSDLKANKIKLPNFSFCKILKKLSELIQSYEDVSFSGPKCPICPEQKIFKYKPLLLLSYTYRPFSLCQILKIFSGGSRLMRMRNFWVQNGPFPKMRICSENLLMSLVFFIHAYLYAKNQKY